MCQNKLNILFTEARSLGEHIQEPQESSQEPWSGTWLDSYSLSFLIFPCCSTGLENQLLSGAVVQHTGQHKARSRDKDRESEACEICGG